jgi:hypothetical protein
MKNVSSVAIQEGKADHFFQAGLSYTVENVKHNFALR